MNNTKAFFLTITNSKSVLSYDMMLTYLDGGAHVYVRMRARVCINFTERGRQIY